MKKCTCEYCTRHENATEVIEYLESHGKHSLSDIVRQMEEDIEYVSFELEGIKQTINRDASVEEHW